jgi:hypothetical protein
MDNTNLPAENPLPDGNIGRPANGNRFRKWIYIAVTAIAISIALCTLMFIVVDTYQQSDRQIVTGVEKYSQSTENSKIFKTILDDVRSGKDVASCMAELGSIKENINAKRMIIGFETYSELQKYVSEEDDIHYEDLQKKIQPFLDEVRSHYDIGPDTLYFAYMARDLILYMFIHKEIFLIHDGDRSIMGIDSRSLEAYSQDALSVYHLLKRIIRDQIKEKTGFWKDADNGNLFIVAMYCMARWATDGVDDSQVVEAIFHSLEANEFRLAGQPGTWFKWFETDLHAVRNRIFRTRLKENRPNFVSTTWLK